LLKDSSSTSLIWLYALVILGNATLETTTGAMQVFDRFAVQAKVNILRRVLYLLGVLTTWAAGAGVIGVLAAYLLGNSAANVMQARAAFKEARERIGPAWWRAPLRSLKGQWQEMRNFALITNLGSTLTLIVRDSDLLLLGFFRGATEVGYYKLALQLLKIPFATGTPMMSAIFPEIARTIGKRDAKGSRRLLGRGTLVAAAWVLPLALGALLFTPWIIRTFFGQEFLPAVILVYILLIGNTVGKLLFWSRPTLLALGRPDIPFKITLLHTGLKVALVLWLLPKVGYTALAWILSALMVLSAAISVPFIHRALGRMEREEATRVPAL
jgi:O-antigen/teichoic acid export membrane protein